MGDLLEALRRKSKCNYISDLHEHAYASKVKTGVLEIADGDYGADEWTCAAVYISGRSSCFQTAAEAKSFLSEYLSGK